MTLDRWLADGEAPEADWSSLVLRRANRGELGDGGRGLLLDLVALGQPYACASAACTPGRRATSARSCCADLDVAVSDDEIAVIDGALPDVARTMAADPRWARGAPDWHHDGVLRRPGRRCVFAVDAGDGLRCGLQQTRAGLKPTPCRLFPLALVDLGDGSRLLTAVHRTTARHLATRPARAFPCLAEGAPPLYVSERATIEAEFGKAVWRRLHAALADAPTGRPRPGRGLARIGASSR